MTCIGFYIKVKIDIALITQRQQSYQDNVDYALENIDNKFKRIFEKLDEDKKLYNELTNQISLLNGYLKGKGVIEND